MSVSLREGESIRFEADLHWLTHLFSGIWAALCTPAALMMLFGILTGKFPLGFLSIPLLILVYYGPLIYTVMKNKCKQYLVTNERLYIEEGIFNKRKRDIPLNKVNDIEVAQGVLQRFFHAGDILIMTGNDKPICLGNVAFADIFKKNIYAAIKGPQDKA